MRTTEILAHRGLWDSKERGPNTFSALNAALQNKFGIETDIRLDLDGRLVISHDPLESGIEYIGLDQLIEARASISPNSKLALNIKEDGLHPYISTLVQKFDLDNYFLFDMSVPDYISGSKYDPIQYCRASEFESANPFIGNSHGVWLDFFKDSLLADHALGVLAKDWYNVALVSPELHGKKNYYSFWESIVSFVILMTCIYQSALIFHLNSKLFRVL